MTRSHERVGEAAMPPLQPLAMPVQSLEADWAWVRRLGEWLDRLFAPDSLRGANSRSG